MKRLVVHCLMVLLAGLGPIGCHRSGLKEAPLTGRPTDPPTAMAARWESGRRYLYRVDVSSSAVVPRRNSGTPIRAETTLGQDLAFTISNAPAGGGKVVQMELLALQMETTKDDGVTMTFDSGNKAIFIEESPL